MKSIPNEIQIMYSAVLNQKSIPQQIHSNYKKWLRYYLNFCHKYHHEPSIRENVSPFIKKLKDKNQTEQQWKQAFDAVSIVYQIDTKKEDQNKAKVLNTKNIDISTKKTVLKSTNADWRHVYSGLESEIALRHYSPRTLEAYRSWVRHLQGFTKSKDPQLLCSEDVREKRSDGPSAGNDSTGTQGPTEALISLGPNFSLY